MVVRCLAYVVFVTACGAVFKPPEPNRRLDLQVHGTLFESDRGYRFAALPEEGSSVVRLDVRYPVGSADDPPGKEGLAHLVEHLLFEAQFNRGDSKTTISAELGKIAFSSNASTHEDYTNYEVLAPANALDTLLKLEVDRVALGCAGLTPEIVAREREVVLNELRQRQGANGAALRRQIYEAVYPDGHPYRRVDSVETVAKLELADVCAFLTGPYQRGKAIVIASGGVDGATLKAAAGRQFGRLRKRLPDTRQFPPRAPSQPGTTRIRGDVDEPTLLVTWPLPPSMTAGARLLNMVWPSIPGRIGAFGFTFGWGHSTSATIMGGEYAPVLAVSVTLSSADKLDDAVDATKKAVAYARRILGENRESPEWIGNWEAEAEGLLADWESLSTRNRMYGDFLQFDQGEDFLIARVAELSKWFPGDAKELAETWLSPSRARYILIEPAASTSTGGHRTYTGGTPAHAARVDGSLADKPLPVPSTPRLETVRYSLGNGLNVVLWPYGSSSLVHGRLVVDSGQAHEPAGKEGTSLLVGANTETADSLMFRGRSLSNRVDDVVGYLASELRSPGYDLSDESKAFLRGRLQMARARERMSYDRELRSAVYGSRHPYARASMSEDSLEHISRDTVIGWARDHMVARNATLVFAGKFDPELVKKHIAYNADHVSSGTDSKDVDATPTPQQAFIAGVTAKPTATVELVVHFTSGTGIDRDYAKRLVLESVLDSRLSELRGTQALTYGFSASYAPRRAGGLWAIGGEADATRAGEAASSLVTILHEMRTDPESYRAAFVLARQKILESLLVNTTSARSIADELVMLARFDLEDDFFQIVAEEVARLTLTELHQFVTAELDVQGQVFGAFGNAADAELAVEHARKTTSELGRTQRAKPAKPAE